MAELPDSVAISITRLRCVRRRAPAARPPAARRRPRRRARRPRAARPPRRARLRERVGEPDEALERAVDAEARPGGQAHAVLRGDRGERAAARRVELDPERQAAAAGARSASRAASARSAAASASRRARSAARWGISTASGSASSSVATSCSTTGLERSTVARASASRWTSVGLARIQPIRSPAQNALLIEPIAITVSPPGSCAASGAGAGAAVVEPDLRERLVDDQRGARRARQGDEALALAVRQRQAGRVVVVRDHVREPRRGLAQRRRVHLEVPAVRAQRDRHRPRADGADRVERVRIGRVVDEHAVAGAGEHAQQERERVLRARGHEHLVRCGRRAAAGRGARRRRRAAPAGRARRSPGRAGAAAARRSPRRARGAARPPARRWPRS